jgi:hypothetical protein
MSRESGAAERLDAPLRIVGASAGIQRIGDEEDDRAANRGDPKEKHAKQA